MANGKIVYFNDTKTTCYHPRFWVPRQHLTLHVFFKITCMWGGHDKSSKTCLSYEINRDKVEHVKQVLIDAGYVIEEATRENSHLIWD